MVSDEQLDAVSQHVPSAEEQMLHRNLQEQILRCIQQLPVNDRTVIHLRLIEGFSIADTAKVMSKTTFAVKSLQTRAKKKLMELVRKEVSKDDG
jgi:RNA polymerase sigma-70 factor, ECF subfamily